MRCSGARLASIAWLLGSAGALRPARRGARPTTLRAVESASRFATGAGSRTTFAITFYSVDARAAPGTRVRGEVADAGAPGWRFDLYPGGRSRTSGERGRSAVYLTRTDRDVDATFTVRLLAPETTDRGRPAVEADGGGRFRGDGAPEAGAALVTPDVLPTFVASDGAVECEAEIVEWPSVSPAASSWPDLPAIDARASDALHAGATFVPLWRTLAERSELGAIGCYGGVDYVVDRVVDAAGAAAFAATPGSTLVVRPKYPLVRRLERVWPVEVPEAILPLLVAPNVYTRFTAVGAAGLAAGWLAVAGFLAANVGGLVEVPTRSMEPAIYPGDTLVVEKITPRLRSPATGEVIVFEAPPALRKVSGNDTPQLYVKRVAATAGDRVVVNDDGIVTINGALRPSPAGRNACDEPAARTQLKRVLASARSNGVARESLEVPKGSVYVLGDCPDVSVDSRVWGPLETRYVKGRPVNAALDNRR